MTDLTDDQIDGILHANGWTTEADDVRKVQVRNSFRRTLNDAARCAAQPPMSEYNRQILALSASGAQPVALSTLTGPLVAAGLVPGGYRQELIDWAAEQWHAQVANRPMVNVHRRSLDDVWRQVLRHLGVDDRARLGPTHDELRAEITAKEWEAMQGKEVS